MDDPFKLPFQSALLSSAVNKTLGLDPLAKIYRNRPSNQSTEEFLQYCLDSLGVTLLINNQENFADIPTEGPLLIVANHPLGGLEGVALARILMQVRPDLRVLTNQLLRRIPELATIFIGVDVISTNAAKDNVSGIKQVNSHLKNGGALLIFPAGVVSTYEFKHQAIADKPWNRLVGQLVKRHQCPCVPVRVGGRNSTYFYLAGMIHKRLRTALLARQLANKKGFQLPVTIGKTIPGKELSFFDNPRAITEYLRISTDALAGKQSKSVVAKNFKADQCAEDIGKEELLKSIETLNDCRLLEHKDFDVYCAPFSRLGVIMDQIAISREITFRSVGEGTGLSKDSDEFDKHYLHLFLWDKNTNLVAGAYRVGRVDDIVEKYGVSGLYSRSLYKYNRDFIRRMGPAIEMGRSFIHPEYQRRPLALNLLWRGIGTYLVNNPQYHTLFGSVSISREYTDLARSLIADSMMTNYQASGFTDLVKPLTPLHYLSLNGKLVCFNIHSKFNHSLEGLIIVDMRLCESKTAIRFMGEEGYNSFIANHTFDKTA
jgi:putative hemolysin